LDAPHDVKFGDLLRQLRIVAQLTQEELAVRSDISTRTISDLERGVANFPHADTVLRLAQGLELGDQDRAQLEAAARGRVRLAAPRPTAITATGTTAAIQTLPHDIAAFTGREAEFAQLLTKVDINTVVSIHAIGGMAGVGKTAFAVHAAHKLAPGFPDGQIFVPLHGHTPGREPVNPAHALASLLLTAGVETSAISGDQEALSRFWRDKLAGRRLLVVLDDAVDSEHVRPFLPGSAGCLVLITSRRHLTALEDAQSISLDTMQPDDAAQLVVRLADREDINADHPAIAGIARLCGYLPLALGMLARQLHHHPTWTAAGLAAELAAAKDRLELMRAENLSVSAALDLSYADLTESQRRLFRRLGLLPGTDIDTFAAAALDGTSLAVARRHLEDLYDHYLISEFSSSRYRMHDLTQEHARALAAADSADERATAVDRLLDYYQHTANLAEARLARQTRPGPGPATWPESVATPDLNDPSQALAWARADRASLLACLEHTNRTGQQARVVAFTAALAGLLRRDGPWTDAISCHTAAVRAARDLSDRLGEANALSDLGDVRRLTGDYADAAQVLEQALGIYRDLGDRLGEANALSDLGAVRRVTDDNLGAAQLLEQALGIYRDLGNQNGQARALNYLGIVHWLAGAFPAAAQALEQALGICRDLGDKLGQVNTLSDLGSVRRLMGDYPDAAQALEEALDICRELDDRYSEANALNELGVVRRLMGRYTEATRTHEQALGIYRDLGNRHGEANAFKSLGNVQRLTGDYRNAAQALDHALGIYSEVGDRGGEVEALNDRGTLHWVSGELALAQSCHQQALELARDIASSWDEACALAGLGRCAILAGHDTEAEVLLHQAHEIFQSAGAAADALAVLADLEALTSPPHVR
jgi:tetratricopeptide (TPR) repeat protein/transcriptional regulator with XRE-family HTH domain